MTTTEDRSVQMPAGSARLRLTFDAERMLRELTEVTAHTWERQRAYDEQGVGEATEIDWRCLALRSPGGDPDRTDPGGPGPEDFADTDWLDQLPYLRHVLESIPAPVQAARLMALGPGAVGVDHHDPKYNPHWGFVRLHIPVVTNPEALLVLDGIDYNWQPGEFWFGDFSRTHRVQNHGTEYRTHLVIDALVVPELADIFPDGWEDYFAEADLLFNRWSSPQPAAERAQLACTLELPAGFMAWEEDTEQALDGELVPATVEAGANGLTLVAKGQRLGLVHLGEHEYRLVGWSEERTIQLFTEGPQPRAVLRSRLGRGVSEVSVPVVPAGS